MLEPNPVRILGNELPDPLGPLDNDNGVRIAECRTQADMPGIGS